MKRPESSNSIQTPSSLGMTLRALAWLLRYPDAAMRAQLPMLRTALHGERALSEQRLSDLDALITSLKEAPGLTAEVSYVALFDRNPRTSLNLFEHVHGDSRERGPAMLDLIATYRQAGLDPQGSDELPDYLPMVLEFASTQPPATARAFIAEFVHIAQRIEQALSRRGSSYAAVLAALLELAGSAPLHPGVDDDEEADMDSLDERWMEPPAFPGNCPGTQAQTHQVARPSAIPIRWFDSTPAVPSRS